MSGSVSFSRVSGSVTEVMPSFTGPADTTTLVRKILLVDRLGLNVGDDDLGGRRPGCCRKSERFADAQLEILGGECDRAVFEQRQRLHGVIELDLGLIEAAAGSEGFLVRLPRSMSAVGHFCWCSRSTKS